MRTLGLCVFMACALFFLIWMDVFTHGGNPRPWKWRRGKRWWH